MFSLNEAQILGNLGSDPELRYTTNGQPVCEVRVATNERWTDKSGQKQEKTEWHRCVFWGKPAEIVKEHARKGEKIYVKGRMQTRTWDDEDGVKRYTTEIIASDFILLGANGKPSVPVDESAPEEHGAASRSDRDPLIPF